MVKIARIVAAIGIGALGLVAAGFSYQQWSQRQDAKDYPPPGRLVDVGNHRLHIRCIGAGSPTVVMMSGAGSPSVNSFDLQDQIGRITRVCSYDRAGLGWSDPPPRPLGLVEIVDDLETLLSRSGEKGPFILVPESFGGTVAVAFVTRHPSEVAGIVGVDPTEPSRWRQVTGEATTTGRWRNVVWQLGWRVGLVRLLLDGQAPGWAAGISPAHRGQFDAVWSRPMANFSHDWIDAYEQTPARDVPVARPGLLGDKPLIVISHGVISDYLGEDFQRTWPAAQAQWTAMSRSGVNVIATRNTHMIAQENPMLVAAYVRSVVEKVRSEDRYHAAGGAIPREGPR